MKIAAAAAAAATTTTTTAATTTTFTTTFQDFQVLNFRYRPKLKPLTSFN